MASPSVVRDVRSGVEPAYLGKHEQLTTRNGCHEIEQTSSGTPKRRTSPKKEKEDLTSDITTTASPRAKGPKKTSKRVDGKKTKKTQICAQTRSVGLKERAVICKTSQSQPSHENIKSESEDVLKAMSELKISDKGTHCGKSGGKKTVEVDKVSTNAIETKLKNLSLENTQQLVERGPQRNRDLHSVHQTKPYDKSTDPPGQRSADEGTDDFIRSVLFDEEVVGASGAKAGSSVPTDRQPCGQPSDDFVDQWLDSITVNNNVPSCTTIGNTGHYQFSGPSIPPSNVGVQSCGQVPIIVPMPGVPVQTVPQIPHCYATAPLTHSTPQTFVSGHQICTTALVNSGAPVSNAYIFFADGSCYNPNVNPVNTAMSGNNYYQPPPSINVCDPRVSFMSGSGQASIPIGNSSKPGNTSSEMGSESTLNSQICSQRVQADHNIQTQGDADLTSFGGHNPIPTVVPEIFDYDPNEDDSKKKKRGKKAKDGKTPPRKSSSTTKKERKSKDSPKKTNSVPTQSPGSNSGDVCLLNLTGSPLTNCVTPPLANDQTLPHVPDDFNAMFEDSMNVVESNIKEDFRARKMKKKITSVAGQGTSEPSPLGEESTISDNVGSVCPLPNYQMPQSSSAVNQPQNTYDGAYHPNSLDHSQQSIPAMTATQQVTHNQHMATFTPPISAGQQLQQTSQINYTDPCADLFFQQSPQQPAFPADKLSSNVTSEQTTQFPPYDQYVPLSQTAPGYQQATYGVPPSTQSMMTSPHSGPAPMVQNSPVFQTPQPPQCVQQTGYYQNSGTSGVSYQCTQQPVTTQPLNVQTAGCQTQVNVNVTHQAPSHQFQQQPGPHAQFQHPRPFADLNNVQFEAFRGIRQFKMTTAGFSGSKPIGSSAFEDIMKKYPTILPKPSVS